MLPLHAGPGDQIAPFTPLRLLTAWTFEPVLLAVIFVVGALYLLRGAAIVVACAVVLGVSPLSLIVGSVAAALLAVPLLFVLPGLATLGITDTWLEFRRRLAGRPNPRG